MEEEKKKYGSVTEYFGTPKERSDHIALQLNKLVVLGKSIVEIIEYMREEEKLTDDEMCGFLFSLGVWFGRVQAMNVSQENRAKIITLD